MPSQEQNRSKAYHHGDLKKALIDAGLHILSTDGVGALSLRKVARIAGVSHTAPYNHFANKQALIGAIAAEGFGLLTESMMTSCALFPGNPRQQLMEVGWGYVRFGLENPDHLRVMFSADGRNALLLADYFEPGKAFQVLLDVIQACQAAGDIADGDPFPLAFSAWSMVHGTAVLLINTPFPPEAVQNISLEQMARANIQTLFHGLLGVG